MDIAVVVIGAIAVVVTIWVLLVDDIFTVEPTREKTEEDIIRDGLKSIKRELSRRGVGSKESAIQEGLRKVSELLVYEETEWDGVAVKFYKYKESVKVMDDMLMVIKGVEGADETIDEVLRLIGLMYKDILGEGLDKLLAKKVSKETSIMEDINRG